MFGLVLVLLCIWATKFTIQRNKVPSRDKQIPRRRNDIGDQREQRTKLSDATAEDSYSRCAAERTKCGGGAAQARQWATAKYTHRRCDKFSCIVVSPLTGWHFLPHHYRKTIQYSLIRAVPLNSLRPRPMESTAKKNAKERGEQARTTQYSIGVAKTTKIRADRIHVRRCLYCVYRCM